MPAPQPLDADHVVVDPDDRGGCYALFRPYEEGDPERFERDGWTCLRLVCTVPGETLAHALHRERSQRASSAATAFRAWRCKNAQEQARYAHELWPYLQPIEGERPPAPHPGSTNG